MRSRLDRCSRRPRGLVFLAACLLVLLASGDLFAQSAREPILVPTDGATYSMSQRVPFLVGDDPGYADPRLDDSTWGSMPVPAWWHSRGMSKDDRTAWYRIHLRLPEHPPEGLAVLVPPTFASWELYAGGRIVARSGGLNAGLSGAGREAFTKVVLPRRNLRGGHNVLALRVASAEGHAGVLGAFTFGTEGAIDRRLGRRVLLSSGLLLVFGVLMLFHLAVWTVSRSDRQSLLFALTMGCVAIQAFANNDHFYLLGDSTELKLRLRWAARFGVHGFGVLFFAESIAAEVARPARVLAWTALAGVLASLAFPFVVAADLFRLSWLFTVMTLLYALDLAQGLPTSSPLIASGVRAGLVGSMLALFYEVFAGIYELPGPGAFELGSLPLAFALVGTVAMGAGLAHLRAARVVSASRDGIVVLKRDRGVELSNPAMQALLGRTGVQLRNDGVWPFLPKEAAFELRAAIARAFEAGAEAAVERHEVIVEAVGRLVSAEVFVTPLDAERVLMSFRDVTERQDLERRVAQAQRLDSLGMLAGGIAHDFNNLLAGILASAPDLEPDSELSADDRSKRVGAIVESARRGGALTQRLLQFARGRQELPVGVDLESMLPDLVDMLGRTLGKRVEWRIDIEPDLPWVSLDEAELEQVLVNLCVNARDAMESVGGTIGVEAALLEGDDGVQYVGLTVHDDGPGIPDEILEHVFEPFVTTKGSGAGTGLGLALVYGIVTGRGGDLVVHTNPRDGTTVTLLLPIHVDSDGDSIRRDDLPADIAPPDGLRVLLVDDEPALRTYLGGALQRRGMEVETMVDGRAAIEWAQAQDGAPQPIDVVVMDMMMPVVDGVEAASVLREQWPGLPVIISSGYTGREGIEPLQHTGPTMLLGKPYQVDELVAALGRVTAGDDG
ncbi:MAG: response regulator [Proteobacteria bacterium]|nr:response regulator [Pseudomonadota bacterium]